MNFRSISFAILCIILIGCVPKSENEKLEGELKQMRQELNELKQSQGLDTNKTQSQKNQNNISEEKALKCIDDYFDFYDRDTEYRKVELRRISENSFEVCLETCDIDFIKYDYMWSSSNWTLTVYSNGKYDFKEGIRNR